MRNLDVFPLPGGSYRKTSGYGPRVHPVTGAQTSFHRGVDYGAVTGTPVYAPFEGQVTTGFQAGGAGNWSNVTNGPDQFRSFHHSGVQVRSGWVRAGDVIAYIGTTGSSTGPHGHFELWENGRNIDPTGYLDRAPLKGSSPAPAPEEEDEEVSLILWNSDGAYLVSGVWKHNISLDSVNYFKRLGVKDLGNQPEWLAGLADTKDA